MEPDEEITDEQLVGMFCRDYVAWIDGDSQFDDLFRNYVGLCSNFNYWMTYQNPSTHNVGYSFILKNLFRRDGLDPHYPFNRNAEDYSAEEDTRQNKERVTWARKHALYCSPYSASQAP
jgi:hypothetical protein